MLRHLILTLLLTITISASAALPITERNYLYEDSLIWARYDSIGTHVWKEIERHPAKKDSLMAINHEAFLNSLEENISTAIRYAAVPSGIRRVYMVRNDIPKDSLSSLLTTVPDSIRTSFYGKLVKRHIDTQQLAIGDSIATFPCSYPDGTPFNWNLTNGKNVLIVYSGYKCMGKGGRQALIDLYSSTSRDDLEIVHYWIEPANQKEFQNDFASSGFLFPVVTDYLRDATPIKIIYGCQAMPTYYFFDRSHRLLYKGTPDEFPWETMEQHLGLK